jgi:hypothetical protein
LVAAWKRSGLPPREFAAKHGLLPKRLSWWRWYLESQKSGADQKATDGVRLVPVEVSREAALKEAQSLGVAWELTTATGHVLRVDYISPGDLKRLTEALLRGKGRR